MISTFTAFLAISPRNQTTDFGANRPRWDVGFAAGSQEPLHFYSFIQNFTLSINNKQLFEYQNEMLKHFTYLVFFLIFSYILTLILIAFWLNTSPAKVNNNQITIKDPDFLFYCDPPSKGICSRATSFNVDVTNTFKEEVNLLLIFFFQLLKNMVKD